MCRRPARMDAWWKASVAGKPSPRRPREKGGTNRLQRRGPLVVRMRPSIRSRARSLLAPEAMVVALGLIDPTIRFEATRSGTTRHAFVWVGREAEGARREAAQDAVTTCTPTLEQDAAVRVSIAHGVDALIFRDCDAPPALLASVSDATPGHAVNG